MKHLAPLLLISVACSGPDTAPLEQCFTPTIAIDVCDPTAGAFDIDPTNTNPLFPLVPGNHIVLEGDEDGENIVVELTVLDETELVAGVTTRVVEAREIVDGELYEIARDFYAHTADGTVCYFGEDVEFYEGGAVINNDGTWRAGIDGAIPGVFMPANPAVGQSFFQEQAPDARDMARVIEVDATVSYNGTEYTGAVRMLDSNPLEGEEGCGEEEEKVYIPGIGLAADTVKTLQTFTPPVDP